jgi:isopropylmalate/homocitrate/citramalate synthase
LSLLSGIHVKAMLSNTMTYEPLQPEEFGRERRYVIGKHSGSDFIRKRLEELNLRVSEEQFEHLFKIIKTRKISTRRDIESQIEDQEYFNGRFFGIPEEEFIRIVKEITENNHENGE